MTRLKVKSPSYTNVLKQVAIFLGLFSTIILTTAVCGPKAATAPEEGEMALSLSSTAFKQGGKSHLITPAKGKTPIIKN